jgi:hypothetical protein
LDLLKSLVNKYLKYSFAFCGKVMKGASMTLARNTTKVSGGSAAGAEVVHLLLTEGDVKLMAENPERVMEDIEARATVVSSVLADILMEPHGRTDWGLNE